MAKKSINDATQDDLLEIPQMSSARAQTIIHYRDQHGKFADMRQISNVPGIGETMALQMAEYFDIGGIEGGSDDQDDADTTTTTRKRSVK